MGKQNISFTSHLIEFSLAEEEKYISVLKQIFADFKKDYSTIQYIFCDDAYLLELNKTHLNHDFYTDILTFPYGTELLESDIFISIDRVKENAESFGVSFDNELSRVIVHGVLHLVGMDDQDPNDREKMRLAENQYIDKIINN